MMKKVTPEKLCGWVQRLREIPGWIDHLQLVFDDLGFTDNYIDQIQTPGKGEGKSVKDKIWGMIELSKPAVELVDCPLFQRLRSVRQLGFTYLTYPTARHTRFEHCVGVYHVVQLLLNQFERTYELSKEEKELPRPTKINKDEVEIIKIAAMLHDIGHGPFSHASEMVFFQRRDMRKFGPQTVSEFIDLFDECCPRVINKKANKLPLAELMSAVVVTSDRFRRFLDKIFPEYGPDDFHVSLKIATLILGGRLEKNDLATPSILSGPTDADKIDYMRRDSVECGISLGIDLSRVFIRAGIYDCAYSEVKRLIPDADVDDREVKLFLIDRSGQDTIQEFGAARLSLYSRVYHHPFTRNAERKFQQLMDLSLENNNDSRELRPCNDFISLWSLPEDVLLYLLKKSNNENVSKATYCIINRKLPARAFSYSDGHFRDLLPTWLKDRFIQKKSFDKQKMGVVDWLDSISLSPKKSKVFETQLFNEAKKIIDLVVDNVEHELLPENERPGQFYIVGRPDPEEVILKGSYILNADKTLGTPDTILPAYYEAGALARSIGYGFCDKSWTEIIALSFQKVLATSRALLHEIDFNWMSDEPLPSIRGAEEAKTKGEERLPSIFRPLLNLTEVANRCKLGRKRLVRLQAVLGEKGYYDDLPNLVPAELSDQVADDLAMKFRAYQGDANWEVDIRSVRAYISQFPPRLREEAVEMIRKIIVLDRPTITMELSQIVQNLEQFGKETIRLVPLTPSSGSRVRDFLGSFAAATDQLDDHSNIEEALSVATEDETIVFVDDNIGSGMQSSLQLKAWFDELDADESDDNIELRVLPEENREKLRQLKISFIFYVGHENGRNRLTETTRDLDLRLTTDGIHFKKNLEDLSGKSVLSDDIREFLSKVGYAVLYRRRRLRHPEEDPETWRSYAEANKLGFGGFEALIATALNVPSSTYPALWCPGVYWPDGDVNDIEDKEALPWVPLLIRNDSARLLVLP